MSLLARPRVLFSIIAALLLTVFGILFLQGHLEIPPLKIDPSIEIPIPGLDWEYPLRSTVIQQWLAMAVILGLTWFATRKMEVIPGRMQALAEAVVEGLLNLCQRAAGVANGRRFFPIVATIFLFVAGANLLGFIPGTGTFYKVISAEEEVHHYEEKYSGAELEKKLADLKLYILDENNNVPVGLPFGLPTGGFEYELGGETVQGWEIYGNQWEDFHANNPDLNAGHLVPFLRPANTDVNTPFAIAVWSAIFVEFWGVTSLGLFSYLGKFFNFGRLLRGNIPFGLIDVFVGFVDLISELVRLLSFTFRLFGNVFAGEILILMMSFFVPLTFVIGVFFMEVFFGIIQAFIFAILTLIFGILAVTHHGGEDHGGEHHEEAAAH